MSAEKVYRFPFRETIRSEFISDAQLELFDHSEIEATRIAFIEPDIFDQDRFFSMIARNHVNVIFDYRPRPIFRRPKYSHREVTSYFYRRNLLYIEIARYAQRYRENIELMSAEIGQKLHQIRRERSIYCLGLFDQVAIDEGIVDEFRASLAAVSNGVVEVHPRSLLR